MRNQLLALLSAVALLGTTAAQACPKCGQKVQVQANAVAVQQPVQVVQQQQLVQTAQVVGVAPLAACPLTPRQQRVAARRAARNSTSVLVAPAVTTQVAVPAQAPLPVAPAPPLSMMVEEVPQVAVVTPKQKHYQLVEVPDEPEPAPEDVAVQPRAAIAAPAPQIHSFEVVQAPVQYQYRAVAYAQPMLTSAVQYMQTAPVQAFTTFATAAVQPVTTTLLSTSNALLLGGGHHHHRGKHVIRTREVIR